VLLDVHVRVRARSNLREMRDAQHLEHRPQRAKVPANDVSDTPADTSIDFIEDEPGSPGATDALAITR
jgi:hypothetical protein